ncbi:MAG TPA: hypothetical protein VGV13_13720 [Methylomirabilota bacterium]|jgi:hypothetical protein|nr:hypothetical protein [Methylomirabilota bacterium]
MAARVIERHSDRDGEIARVEERDDGFYFVASRGATPSAHGPMALVDALFAMNEFLGEEDHGRS